MFLHCVGKQVVETITQRNEEIHPMGSGRSMEKEVWGGEVAFKACEILTVSIPFD
jgi:hypothetical protein